MRKARVGFTLVELLVVVAILAMLVTLIVPAVAGAISWTRRAMCASNLHNLGSAVRQYLVDSRGWMFPVEEPAVDDQGRPGKLWYFGFEAEESRTRPEGQRELDKTRARLDRYAGTNGTLEVCPGFDFKDPLYKPKFKGAWWSYGINGGVAQEYVANHVGGRADMDSVIVFADAAQVNYWQAPASVKHPMYEEWHLVAGNKPNIHFRHAGAANVLTMGGAVYAVNPIPGSFDRWLPEARIGRLEPTGAYQFAPG